MTNYDDLTREERDERNHPLVEALRDTYSTPAQDAQSLARIRERLLESATRQEMPGRVNGVVSSLLRPGPWHPFSTIAAVLCIALLIGSFLAVFNLAHQHSKGAPVKKQTPVVAKHVGSISYIQMFSSTTGWALTNQAVLHTTDGGTSWKDVVPSQFPGKAEHSSALAALTASTAWVAVVRLGTADVQVYHTVDAGQTWRETTIHYTSSMMGIVTITFINAQVGWIMAELAINGHSEVVVIFRTTDSGQTWTKVSSSNAFNNTPGALPSIGQNSGLSFRDASTGWATGLDSPVGQSNFAWLYMTVDGGQTWQHQTLVFPRNVVGSSQLSIAPPTFFTANDGILPVTFEAPAYLVVYITHDGGATWQPITPVPALADTTDFIDINHGWVASGTTLYMTGDGGQSWTKVFPGDLSSSAFLMLDFVSNKIGWAINYDYSNQSYSLLKTVDGGHTWTKINYMVS
jgi:photosystem II stability/assembly factor-like uncharacterized protein